MVGAGFPLRFFTGAPGFGRPVGADPIHQRPDSGRGLQVQLRVAVVHRGYRPRRNLSLAHRRSLLAAAVKLQYQRSFGFVVAHHPQAWADADGRGGIAGAAVLRHRQPPRRRRRGLRCGQGGMGQARHHQER